MAEESYVQIIRLSVCARALEICLGLGEGHPLAGTDGYSLLNFVSTDRAKTALQDDTYFMG
jgi:hypothetical protein